MTTSAKLSAELKTLEARRAEIAAEADEAEAAHQAATEGLLAKGRDAAQRFSATHERSVSLTGALDALDARISETREQVRLARLHEEREQDAAQARTLAIEARGVVERHAELLREAASALSVAAAGLLELRARHTELSDQVRELEGERLSVPEWHNAGVKFAPLVLQAALELGREREKANYRAARG